MLGTASPPDVADAAAAAGVEKGRIVSLTDGQRASAGTLGLEFLGGYDGSYDERGRMNKFSLLVTLGKTALWFSGDCHSLPPTLPGRNLDAVLCWTKADVVAALAGMPARPKRFLVMHCDRHEPGNFWCNRDPAKEAESVAARMPGVEVTVPDRLAAFAHFAI